MKTLATYGYQHRTIGEGIVYFGLIEYTKEDGSVYEKRVGKALRLDYMRAIEDSKTQEWCLSLDDRMGPNCGPHCGCEACNDLKYLLFANPRVKDIKKRIGLIQK